ncbi:MAG: tetratricopeptide repeat protein [Deltaproteobacteria bacterium]|nr:tetratricopeptide repeat protein [Deltaproteobacteria bacterium]
MDPKTLKELLFDAAASGDEKKLGALCQAHRQLIAEQFASWRQLPPAVPGDADAMQRQAQGLLAVAQYFAQHLGDRSLLDRLVGDPQDNPILRWQKALKHIDELMQNRQHELALGEIEALIRSFAGLRGNAVERLLPVAYGRLGECLFHLHKFQHALVATEQALALCEEINDVEGVVTYLGNLVEIHRQRGDRMTAERFAERRAKVLTEIKRPN